MKRVKIGKKTIGPDEPCCISLESSSTYTTKEEAKKMIKNSAEAGADAIKFQTLFPGDAERMLGIRDLKVDFTTPTGKKQELMYDAIKRRELSVEDWKEIFTFSKELNLSFISAPYFPEGVELLAELKIDAIKVSKGDINNLLLVEQIAKTGIPVILDGREKFEDVEISMKICEKNGNEQIVIMHCPSGYPAESAGVHLSAIKKIKEMYDYPVGFADHSLGGLMDYAAVAMGVNMIEKTITLDKTTEHSEHYMSLDPHELKPFIQNIREIEMAMGTPDILNSSRVSENLRRSFIAKREIKKGEKISLELIDFQRPGNMGISCSEGFNILNKVAVKDIPQGSFLQWEMLE